MKLKVPEIINVRKNELFSPSRSIQSKI